MSISNLSENSLTANLPLSGGYIPTISGENNVTVVSPVIRYIRIGNVVTCTFYAYCTALAASDFLFSTSIPIPRYNDFTNDFECSGVASNYDSGTPLSGSVSVSPASQLVSLLFSNTVTTSRRVGAVFSYEV